MTLLFGSSAGQSSEEKVPDHLHCTLKHKVRCVFVHKKWSAALPQWLQEPLSEIPMRAGMKKWIPELIEWKT